MQQEEKQQHAFSCAETKVTVPPPAYSTHQAPPPRYESHGVVMMAPRTHELEQDDSWSVVMHQKSFFTRWNYVFRSWRYVFQQDRWVIHSCLSCVVLLVIILVTVMVFILPSYATAH